MSGQGKIEKAVREEREANASLIRREADALAKEASEDGPASARIVAGFRDALYVWASRIERGEHRK